MRSWPSWRSSPRSSRARAPDRANQEMSAAVVGEIDAARERHARPAALEVVAEVLIPREELARIGVRRQRVVGVTPLVRPRLRGARVEERARPHRDAGGAAAVLVDDRDAL